MRPMSTSNLRPVSAYNFPSAKSTKGQDMTPSRDQNLQVMD